MRCDESVLAAAQDAMHAQSLPLSDFDIRGHSSKCSFLIQRREHLLIGISPFNSRFSPNYVESLLMWGCRNFSKVDVLISDEESSVVLLLATGVPASKAMRKTRKELNRHRRMLAQIIDRIGGDASYTRVIDFSDYFHHHKYQILRSRVQGVYETCNKFRQACIDMSLQAINGRARGVGAASNELASYENVNIAIPYIFAEMPFYLSTPELLGVSTSILAYHRAWPIGDALLAGEFPLRIDQRQGHGIVSIANAGGAESEVENTDIQLMFANKQPAYHQNDTRQKDMSRPSECLF